MPTENERLILTPQEKAQIQEERLRARAARLAEEQQPILADLRAAVHDVQSVSRVWEKLEANPELVPILLKHLRLPYSDGTRSTIARMLAAVRIAEVRKAWPVLVDEYKKAREGRGLVAPGDVEQLPLDLKYALANALSTAVTKKTLDELIDLILDPANGESRILLLSPLRRSKDPRAKEVIEKLAHDPVFAKEISSWKRR